MRVDLLLCDHVSEDLLATSGDYFEMFRRLLASHPEIDLIRYDAVAGQLPAERVADEGLLSLEGGTDSGWMADLIASFPSSAVA